MVRRRAVDEEYEAGEPHQDGGPQAVEDDLPPEDGGQRAAEQHPRDGPELTAGRYDADEEALLGPGHPLGGHGVHRRQHGALKPRLDRRTVGFCGPS